MAVKSEKTMPGKRSRPRRVKSLGRSSAGPTRDNEFTPEEQARIQARIRARGMTFEVFLPESLADWLRTKLAEGVFCSPKEAAFIAFQQLQGLDEHPLVREQLLKAMIEDALQDPRPGMPADQLRDKFRAQLREWANTEPPTDPKVETDSRINKLKL